MPASRKNGRTGRDDFSRTREAMTSTLKAAAAALLASLAACVPAWAQYSKSPPSTTAPSPGPGIQVHSPVAINGQWVDTYYPGSGGDTMPAVVQGASCIVVYYHGGGFSAGSPRDIAGSDLLAASVQKGGCIFLIPSYPTNPGSTVDYPLSAILGSPDRAGSAFGSFQALYAQYIQPWMQANPNLRLWTAGTSAGAIVAQRIAASGHWPVTKTFLIAPPVKNAQYHGTQTEVDGVGIQDPLGPTCASRARNAADCAVTRALFGYTGNNDPAWSADAARNDLSYYAKTTPASVQTHVVINACDDVADLGSFMRGYFNHLAPSTRRISIWRGFSKAEIDALADGPDTPDHAYKAAQHAFYEPILQAYVNGRPADGNWAAWNQATVPPLGGRYVGYCQAGADTEHFRSNLLN
jgi:acetyl esterase/lipase